MQEETKANIKENHFEADGASGSGSRDNIIFNSKEISSFPIPIDSIKIERRFRKPITTFWEQSITEANYCIPKLTFQGDIVLDSFMGLNHDRQFTGFEKDPEVFQIAKTRITTHSSCSKHQNLGIIGGLN